MQEKLETMQRDCENRQTRSRYASYEALDRAIRPTYTQHGFALSFSTDQSPTPDSMHVVSGCRVGRAYRQRRSTYPSSPRDRRARR